MWNGVGASFLRTFLAFVVTLVSFPQWRSSVGQFVNRDWFRALFRVSPTGLISNSRVWRARPRRIMWRGGGGNVAVSSKRLWSAGSFSIATYRSCAEAAVQVPIDYRLTDPNIDILLLTPFTAPLHRYCSFKGFHFCLRSWSSPVYCSRFLIAYEPAAMARIPLLS